MKFKVKKYNCIEEPIYTHVCINENGASQFVDLMVNGDFPEDFDPTELVGKTVEVERIHPYIAIAHNVKIIKEDK